MPLDGTAHEGVPIDVTPIGTIGSYGSVDITDVGATRGSVAGVWKAKLPRGEYVVSVEWANTTPFALTVESALYSDVKTRWKSFSTITTITGAIGVTNYLFHPTMLPVPYGKRGIRGGFINGNDAVLFTGMPPGSTYAVLVGVCRGRVVGYRIEQYTVDDDGSGEERWVGRETAPEDTYFPPPLFQCDLLRVRRSMSQERRNKRIREMQEHKKNKMKESKEDWGD